MPAKAETLADVMEREAPAVPLKIKKKKFRKADESARLVSPPSGDGETTTIERPSVPVERRTFKSIHVSSKSAKPHVPVEVRRYWVGAFATAPFDCKHAFGVTFQRWTGTIEADPVTGKLNLDRARPGVVVELTNAQVEGVREAVARKIVRTVGRREDATGNYRCDTYDVTSHGFRPMADDVPLGRFIYMVEVGELMPENWRDQKPPAMDRD